MADSRSRLVIVDGTLVPVDALRTLLSGVYDVISASDAGGPHEGDVVLARIESLPMASVRAAPLESLATLLNATGEGIALADAKGDVLWSNELFNSHSLGVRKRLGALAEEGAATLARHRRLTPSGSAVSPEASAFRSEFTPAPPDSPRRFDVMVSPVDPRVPGKQRAGEPAWPRAVAVVVRDVTEQWRLRQRIDAVDQAGINLAQIESEAVREKNMIERLQLLQTRIVSSAHDLLHFDHFAIRLLDDKTGKLELVIKHNLPSEYDAFDIYPRIEGNGISGWVAATGKSYLCKDVQADELFLPGLHGARSSLTVPLKLHERVIGIMNVESQQAAAFGDDDRRMAEIFARYIAMAVHTLDLLVVERTLTNRTITGRIEQELDLPLKDITNEVDVLRSVAGNNLELVVHIDKIRGDVEAIRRRLQDASEGPTTLLGVERALEHRVLDPMLVGRRILVADDQSRIRRIIGDVLKNRGCDVVMCEHGGEAIEAIEAAGRDDAGAGVVGAGGFALVISDIMMPHANGYEVFSAAKRALPGVPVILMTGFGYDANHSIVRASQDGLQSVLFKPFQVEQLVDAVKRAVAPRGS